MSYNFGTAIVGTPGERYKLCWGWEPTDLSHFKVEIDDKFGLIGPYEGNYLSPGCTLIPVRLVHPTRSLTT